MVREARTALPARRMSITLDLVHGDHQYIATLGYHLTGELGEVFLEAGKSGTQLDIIMRDLAIAASIALQYGAPVDTLRKAFLRDEDGAPAGVMARLFDMIAARGVFA